MQKQWGKGLFWSISVLLFILMIHAIHLGHTQSDIAVILVLGCITNPRILDMLVKKMGGENDINYNYGAKILLVTCGILFAFIIAWSIYYWKTCRGEVIDENDFAGLIKLIVYITYLLILYTLRDNDKYLTYIVFGLIYVISIVTSYSPDFLTQWIINSLNKVPGGGGAITPYSYSILLECFLNPVKEAILTYIILDTVLGNKDVESEKVESETKVFDVELLRFDSNEDVKRYKVKLK